MSWVQPDLLDLPDHRDLRALKAQQGFLRGQKQKSSSLLLFTYKGKKQQFKSEKISLKAS